MPTARHLLIVTAVLFGALAVAGDAVIMPDGFVVQGKATQEAAQVFNPRNGGPPKALTGFHLLDDGPRVIAFSSHVSKGGKVQKGLPDNQPVVYKTTLKGPPRKIPLKYPILNATITDWDTNWLRTISGKTPELPDLPSAPISLKQQIISLDPVTIVISCDRYYWVQQGYTCEYAPAEIRKLLSTHPDLKDPAGKVDPDRRLAIAVFLKDVSLNDPSVAGVTWLRMAREELARLKTDAPGEWKKETTERFDRLKEEIERADEQRVIDELAAAVAAGRYQMARRITDGYKPTAADAKMITRFTELKAQVETTLRKSDQTATLLAGLVDRESGGAVVAAHAAVAGPVGAAFAPRPTPTGSTAALLDGAAAVLTELHPDTAGRLELFTLLAAQEEQRRQADQKPTTSGPELLALAVSGWLKGKNGADTNVESAVRVWGTRQFAHAYLREPIGNNRKILLDNYTRAGRPLSPDELTQVVTLLPPPFAPRPDDPLGTPVSIDEAGTDRIFRRQTLKTPDAPRGAEYLLRLPAEFHPGRPYPVILALTDPEFPAAKMLGRLAEHADRHGYILAAPLWANQFSPKRYDFTGTDEHPLATAVLRDILRQFPADPDRVFLWGYGNGADFALGLGMAHPDLFAGVVANGAVPPQVVFNEYWKNAQKLPVYAIAGEQDAALSGFQPVFERWTSRGFPALLTVYKGRGADWFRAEVPRAFDWMGRKARARGTASLLLGRNGSEPWQVLREEEDRFYWVGVAPGGLRNPNLLANRKPNGFVSPATFQADISRNQTVTITGAIGIRRFVIWLERDLIDWTKPVGVLINGRQPNGFRPKKLEPDIHLMFEQLYQTGDRKMLYLGQIEVDGPG